MNIAPLPIVELATPLHAYRCAYEFYSDLYFVIQYINRTLHMSYHFVFEFLISSNFSFSPFQKKTKPIFKRFCQEKQDPALQVDLVRSATKHKARMGGGGGGLYL